MSNTKGHMMSLFTRLVIVTVVTISISVVTAILLIHKFAATWNVVPVMVFAVIVPATLAIATNYLYWRPRYKVLRIGIRLCRTTVTNSNLRPGRH